MTASTDPVPERPRWLPPGLFPFTSRFVELDGHRIHYIDEGEGPVLLMLHGNPTWSFVWRHLVLALRDEFRCIALDYPGFGLSQARDGYDLLPSSHARVVAAFVDALALPSFTPVVQDWGGPIGLWVAARLHPRVTALVIGNTMAWPVADDPHFARFSRMMGGALGSFAIRRFNAFVNVMIPLGTKRRRLSGAEMAAYRRPLDTAARREGSAVFPRAIVGESGFLAEVEAGLPALADKPALLVWGDRDIAFREQERQRFAAALPRATTVVLPGAGHYVQEESPDEIAAAIRELWRQPALAQERRA
ncbi:MAG: alpha/beta fold hydrolase [Nannocystaceae bacterium]|nr:alpha/beta fold hydrolase [Nannocystaceae bacterium]